ncbi:hypothetical protein Moror_13953 [Moniliophthora roreri MCA 2997]|uniref:Uncharacterized protein n=2 Tax=Moniliophthora roreri TaxID=221103 RepID=V2X701_MONRO|nr:hypothetical protein Moror_13953 [Moniliophthora roreri MCA 2997]KAI3607664.1 hypothetical protein WG66_004979 [Moniliophthora roreri]
MSSFRSRYRVPRDNGRWKNYHRPVPSHRHSGPSAPWPWIDVHDEVDKRQLESTLPPIPELCDHTICGGCWRNYPQSRFPNWTVSQQRRSAIYDIIHESTENAPCVIYHVDVDTKGEFQDAGMLSVTRETQEEFWELLVNSQRPEQTRVRALFVEHMSGPVLQMLGAKYNIEPFFFSSSSNWIPSRFQEEVRVDKGDHITVILTFLRSVEGNLSSVISKASTDATKLNEVLNTQAPLYLSSGDGCYLVLDLLAVHLIRDEHNNTLISYHHTDPDSSSGAAYLHERIRFAGQSVYWQHIFQRSPDPTFLLLCFIWHSMYSWDEALEVLYNHIIFMEMRIMRSTDMEMTRGLHFIRAHLLHYGSLLGDMKKSVQFILGTPNPTMNSLPAEEQLFSRKLLEKECNHLLIEIERLEMQLQMQDHRLKNVMNLVFSTVNIQDSSRMQELSEAAVRDSAAMKQIAYLTMVFLPASYIATVFGMNVTQFTSESHFSVSIYISVAVPLTIATVWVVMTVQSKYFQGRKTSFWMRLGWPVLLVKKMLGFNEPREVIPSNEWPFSRGA